MTIAFCNIANHDNSFLHLLVQQWIILLLTSLHIFTKILLLETQETCFVNFLLAYHWHVESASYFFCPSLAYSTSIFFNFFFLKCTRNDYVSIVQCILMLSFLIVCQRNFFVSPRYFLPVLITPGHFHFYWWAWHGCEWSIEGSWSWYVRDAT